MMHSIKSGWRPTFALAKQNESEGRKSRIRLSKQERKAMVESFIKKYQESNSGNFPSLNLTHKEVGGSFYTVREIVRDIIQENRVLGPAKFNLEEFNTDQFLEQNPLGSIARGPQPFLGASSNENHSEHNNVTDTNDKMLSVTEAEHQVVDNGHVNIGHVNVTDKEPIEVTIVSEMLSVTEAEHQVVDNGHVNVGHVNVTDKEPIEVTIVSKGCYTGPEHPVVDNGHLVNGNQVDGTNNESDEAPVVSDGCYTGAEHPVVDKGNLASGYQVDGVINEFVEAPIVSDGYHTVDESVIVDRGHGINDTQVDMINKESNEATISEMQANKPMAPEQNVEQELAATTIPVPKVNALTDDLIVETFPLRSVARTADGIEGLGESRDSSNSPEQDIKNLELEEGKKSELIGTEPTKNYNLMDDKLEDALGNNKSKEISNIGHDKEKNLGGTLAESANHSTHKKDSGTDPQVRASHQNAITSEIINQSQIRDGAKTSIQDGFPTKNLSKAYTEGSKPSDDGLHEAEKHRVGRLLGDNSQRRSNITVDRINLESWDGRFKKSAKQDPNPLVALFKAVANAFVKFWSE